MGRFGPSAVEHTTGVVFRVGTPGRLAGRCLWPSLSSRKSKATGVVAVPFSSAFPLCHLLRFLPSFSSFSLSALLLSFLVLYFPCVSLSPLVFIFFAFFSYRYRAVLYFSIELVLFLNLFLSERYVHVSAGHVRLSSYGCPRNGARVKTRKNKWKCRSVNGISVERRSCTSIACMTGREQARILVAYIFRRPSSPEGFSSDLDVVKLNSNRIRCEVHGKSLIIKSRYRAPCGCDADQPSFFAAPVKLPDHVSSARVTRRRGEVRVERVCCSQRYDEKRDTYSRVGNHRWISRFLSTCESNYVDRSFAHPQSRRSPSVSGDEVSICRRTDSQSDRRRVLFLSTNSIVNDSRNTWDASANSILLSWARQ